MFCPPLSMPPAAASGDACSLMSAILFVMEALAGDPAAKAIPEIHRRRVEPAGQQESEKTEQALVKRRGSFVPPEEESSNGNSKQELGETLALSSAPASG